MKYCHEELIDIATIILSGAMDRIECQLPDMPGRIDNREADVVIAAGWIRETAYMQLAILFANQTGDGVSPAEVPGYNNFEQRAFKLIKYRYSKEFTGLKEGEKCSPDCYDLADIFADFCINAEDEDESDFILSLEPIGNQEAIKQTRVLAPSLDELNKAYRDGALAYKDKKPITSNPHTSNYLIESWQAGYFSRMPEETTANS